MALAREGMVPSVLHRLVLRMRICSRHGVNGCVIFDRLPRELKDVPCVEQCAHAGFTDHLLFGLPKFRV